MYCIGVCLYSVYTVCVCRYVYTHKRVRARAHTRYVHQWYSHTL